ncbi:MAG: hypothetical protein ACOX5G_00115 [Kiritimatiellia bacterium]
MLSIADRQVVMQEHAVRQAFTAFLPVLNLTAAGTWTGNDLADARLELDDGLRRHMEGLQRAGQRQPATRRQGSSGGRASSSANPRSSTSWRRSSPPRRRSAMPSRRHGSGSAPTRWPPPRYADYDAKSREGLLPLSDALDARADMDLAQVAMVKSRYQERIALAALDLAMGVTLIPECSPVSPTLSRALSVTLSKETHDL